MNFIWQKIETENLKQEWKELINLFPEASPFQNSILGESYRQLGWKPMYLRCVDESKNPVSAVLMLTRRLPFGFGFAWCPGGPMADTFGEEFYSLPEAVKREGKFRGLFIRGRFDKKLDINDSIRLTAAGWQRSIYPMGSNYSIGIDLSEPKEALAANMSNSWKRNLNRSRVEGLNIVREFNPDTTEMRAVFEEMEKSKGLGELCSKEKLEKLFSNDHGNIIYVSCRDAEGTLLGFRSALLQGRKGVDYLSATTKLGRDRRSSFITMWELLEHCREAGITHYDMGGIDPVTNQGVYQFKKGLGGDPLEFLGEWDWATSNWLRFAGNALIAKRQKSGARTGQQEEKPNRVLAQFYYAVSRVVRAS